MRWLRRRLVAGLVLVALGRMGAGQQVEDQHLPPLQTAGDLGAEIFAQARATGMVLVLVNRTGGILFKGYGEAMPGSGIVPGQESVVRLCSLTKIFTADVLARMLADRKVKLGDSLQSWEPGWASEELRRVKGAVMLPAPRTLKRGRARARETGGDLEMGAVGYKGAAVPTAAAAKRKALERSGAFSPEREMVGRITLEELATHTAGLPREIGEGPRGRAHFTFPDMKERWAWLATSPVTGRPGERALYSNVGFDFLSDALGQAAGRPYVEELDARVLKPLGMWETSFYPTGDQCGRLMRGATDEGPCTVTEATDGSSGLYSTPRDMARWLRYLLAQGYGGAQKVVLTPRELGRAVGLDHAGEPTGMGLGWVHVLPLGSEDHIVEKTGGGAGFQTYIAINHARGTAVFLAVTKGARENAVETKEQLETEEHLNVFNAANKLLLAVSGLPPLPEKVDVPVVTKNGLVVGKARVRRPIRDKRSRRHKTEIASKTAGTFRVLSR